MRDRKRRLTAVCENHGRSESTDQTVAIIIAEPQGGVYNCGHSYTLETIMGRAALTRTNLLLDAGKIRRLRKTLRSRSNSEAVRRVIDERLAVETGLGALQALRKLGGLEDAFERASAKKR